MTVFGLEDMAGDPENLLLLAVLIPNHDDQIGAHITNIRYQLDRVFHQQLLHVPVIH